MTSTVAVTMRPNDPVSHVTEVDFDWLAANAPLVERLCAVQSDPTPFHTWEWLSGWWEVFGAGFDPCIIAVWSGDELAALVPLMHRRRAWADVLEWFAAGRSDHAPLLLRPGFEHSAIRASLEYLRRSKRCTALLSLRTLQRAQVDCWASWPTSGFACADEDVSPRVDIETDWDGYLGRKTKKHRGNIRRILRDQERTSALEIACIPNAPATLQAEIREVEANSWKAKDGSLRMEGQGGALYARFLAQFADRGWLEVWTCRFDGTLLAYLITFRYRERIFYYNGAYRADYERHTELAPGTLLIANALKSAHDRGLRSFDFLRGDEPYKALWATDRRPLYHVLIPLGGWRSRVLSEVAQVRWRLRRSASARRLHATLTQLARRRAS